MSEFIAYFYDNAFTLLTLPLGVLLVFAVHELGHYWAARIVGMKVNQVSIGLGRKIWTKTDRHGTHWLVRMYPFKAYVQISDYNPVSGEALWRRLFVVLAGPVANFILPFFLFSFFFLIWGKPAVPTIITGVEPGMPIYEAGIRPGDKVLAVEGIPVESMKEIKALIEPKRDTPLTLTYQHEDVVHSVKLMPLWAEYRDTHGKLRAHAVLGFLTTQKPISFKWVLSVAGQEVEDDDEARELIIKHLGQSVVFGMDARDRKLHTYLINLSAEHNTQLFDPEHKDYGSFYIGRMGDNIYLPLSFGEGLTEAAGLTGELVINIARLPFNMFPIDKQWITPDVTVSYRSSPVGRNLFMLVFMTSLFSVFIGWLNLIPFPGVDGGVILLNTAEACAKGPLPNKKKALLIASALFLLYGAVFLANAPNLHGYFEFKIEEMFEEDTR